MNLLDRYVIRAMLGGVFVVLAVLLALGALFLFANQQDDIGVGTYTASFSAQLTDIPTSSARIASVEVVSVSKA